MKIIKENDFLRTLLICIIFDHFEASTSVNVTCGSGKDTSKIKRVQIIGLY